MLRSLGSVITSAREHASALVIGVSLATVAAATGFISYTHISALTVHEGQNWKSAHLYALAVDAPIAIGSVIIMEVKGRHRWWGLLGLLPGLGESLAANWASGYAGHNIVAGLWSTVPAQAFACSTFLFELWLRSRRAARPAAAVRPETITQAPEPVAPAAQEAAPALVHVTMRPAGAPWGLVSPAAAPVPVPVQAPVIPVYGPVMTLASRPKARPAAAAGPDDRKPWPDDEAQRARLVNSMTRNELWRTYQLSKHAADKAREQYLDDEKEVA